MNCSEIQERLSLFHDNQLSQDEAARLAAHVANCSTCSAELASFQQLSALAQQLTDPPVPARRWEELQAKLDASAEPKRVPRTVFSRIFSNSGLAQRLALAASILIAVGIGTVVQQTWFSHGQHHLAMNFAHYLKEFPERPDEAQQILLTKYDGRPTTFEEASNVLGYNPAAAQGLPQGYSLDKVYLLDMPCCTCAQIICKNKAGQSIAIFEHAIDQPVWFGDRPTKECLCDEMPTSIVQVGDRLAATWKEGKRHITIIGAADLDEVTEFVSHFKGSHPAKG